MCSTPARAAPRIELGVYAGVDVGHLQATAMPAACMRLELVDGRDRARYCVGRPLEASGPPTGSACSTPARTASRIERGHLQATAKLATAGMRVDPVDGRDRARRCADRPLQASALPAASTCRTPARAKPCIELGVYAGVDVGHL